MYVHFRVNNFKKVEMSEEKPNTADIIICSVLNT